MPSWHVWNCNYRASDEAICFKAKVMLVCLINGRLGESEEYDRAFAPYIKQQR